LIERRQDLIVHDHARADDGYLRFVSHDRSGYRALCYQRFGERLFQGGEAIVNRGFRDD
jgi:hypothetical protein